MAHIVRHFYKQARFSRGTAAEWTAQDPVLFEGEPGLETDTGRVKLGDGLTAWSGLSYSFEGVGGSVTDHEAAADPHTGYRLESDDHTHASTGLQAGTIDHGALTGLSDDDHSQYATNAEFDDHSARHENGGADEISLAGLDGTPTAVSDHTGDAADAHDASAISVLDAAAQYAATDVEAALAEVLDALQAHEADATDAHDASAIPLLDTAAQYTATEVESALAEVLDALQAHEADASDAHDASAISFDPTGLSVITAGNVQDGLEELDAAVGGGGVTSIEADGEGQLSGAVTLSEGTGITLTTVGQDIEIASSAASPAAADVTTDETEWETLNGADVQATLDTLDVILAEFADLLADVETTADEHIEDLADAHDASAISILDTAAQYTATDVEAALAEVLDAHQAHLADTTDVHDHGSLSGLSDDDHPQYATNTEFDDHSARHENGGADEIDLGGLSGDSAAVTALRAVDFLVGTATGELSGEIAVGTSPGGELGGTWASPTVDATHSGSTHSAATDTHIADAADAHDASAISIADAGGDFDATDVEGALAELQGDNEAHVAAADPHTGYLKEADIAAKGDLFAGSADNTVSILSVGTAGQRLTPNTGETTGLDWADDEFTVGGALLDPSGARTIEVWRAPFACEVMGYRVRVVGGTNAVTNAQVDSTDILTGDLTTTPADGWEAGTIKSDGTEDITAGEVIKLEVVSISGSPTEISWTILLRRAA